eukprot:2112415-Rhodomonas_salina.1
MSKARRPQPHTAKSNTKQHSLVQNSTAHSVSPFILHASFSRQDPAQPQLTTLAGRCFAPFRLDLAPFRLDLAPLRLGLTPLRPGRGRIGGGAQWSLRAAASACLEPKSDRCFSRKLKSDMKKDRSSGPLSSCTMAVFSRK